MSDPTTKQCGQCGAVKNRETEFGLNSSAPDGRRSVCQSCRRDNRKMSASKDAQALKAHNKAVTEAKQRLLHPENLTPGEIAKMESVVRLADKHRAALQEKVQAAHAEQERAKQLVAQKAATAAAEPLLKWVYERCGSPLCLTVAELRVWLEKARAVLAESTDGVAVQYAEAHLKPIEGAVQEDDNLQAEMARDAQELLNEKVCRRVIGRAYDQFLPQIRAANTADSKIALREKIRARKKSLMAMAKSATGLDKSGAEKAVVARAIADALEKLAMMLYHGTAQPLSNDTLANIESRQDAANAAQLWLETEEAKRQAYWQELKERDPKQFERESKSLVLQVKGDGHFAATQRKSMAQLKRDDPALYEKLALDALKPRKVTQDVIIYVVMDGKREIFYWPDGRLVKKGEEITFDFRLRRWCLMPGPASTELETPLTSQKMEGYYDEMDCDSEGNPKWKYRVEGSGGTWVQGLDGGWKRTDSGVSPWTRPERLQFVKAPAHVEGSGRDHFAHGQWWTQAEVDAADAADAANPPSLLPPLPRYAVADSLALPPSISARDREKDSRIPYVWARHEQAEKERKAMEAQLLKGK